MDMFREPEVLSIPTLWILQIKIVLGERKFAQAVLGV